VEVFYKRVQRYCALGYKSPLGCENQLN